MNISKQQYDADNITVTVEWAQQEQGALYSAEVSPFVPITNYTETTRYQLTIPYNEAYNFSVVATSPCRPNVTAFEYIILHYGEIYSRLLCWLCITLTS